MCLYAFSDMLINIINNFIVQVFSELSETIIGKNHSQNKHIRNKKIIQ